MEAILDTTFLSAMATPFAAILGMVIAWLVVRKKFSGKEALDFSSNLGGAVPGTILGIGFVMAFNKPSLAIAVVVYAILAIFLVLVLGKDAWERIIILILGTAAGVFLSKLETSTIYYLMGSLYVLLAMLLLFFKRKPSFSIASLILGLYVMSNNWAIMLSKPIADFSRSIERGFWSNAIFQVSDHMKVIFQPPPSLLAILLVFAGILLVQGVKQRIPRVFLGSAGIGYSMCDVLHGCSICIGRWRVHHYDCFYRAKFACFSSCRCCFTPAN